MIEGEEMLWKEIVYMGMLVRTNSHRGYILGSTTRVQISFDVEGDGVFSGEKVGEAGEGVLRPIWRQLLPSLDRLVGTLAWPRMVAEGQDFQQDARAYIC